MSTRRLHHTLLALAVAGLLTLPAMADGESPSELVDSNWILTTLDGTAVPASIKSTLNISADRISGNGGCNSYGGEITITGKTIAISKVFSTMMACDGLSQEQAFFAALQATTSYAIEADNLRLKASDGTVLAELSREN